MEIKAKCRYDLNVSKAVARFSIRRTAVIWVLLYVSSILLVFSFKGFKFTAPAIVGSVIIGTFMWACWFILVCYIVPILRFRQLGRMRYLEQRYVFGDQSFKVIVKDDGYSAESEIDYEYLAGASEDSRYFFLLPTPGRVFAVDKETIEDGTTAEIRSRLSESLKKKFKTRVR